jgi:hypothetical protein
MMNNRPVGMVTPASSIEPRNHSGAVTSMLRALNQGTYNWRACPAKLAKAEKLGVRMLGEEEYLSLLLAAAEGSII